MCPRCDKRCPYWDYSSVCREVQASYWFDNGATVFFAVFMSLWGAFLKSYSRRTVFRGSSRLQARASWNSGNVKSLPFSSSGTPCHSKKRRYDENLAGVLWNWTEMSSFYIYYMYNIQEPPRPEYLIQLHNSKYRKKHKITGVRRNMKRQHCLLHRTPSPLCYPSDLPPAQPSSMF